MGGADSAPVCMDASQATLPISHAGTSVHGRHQLCGRNRIKSAKEAGVRCNRGLDKCWQATSTTRKLSKRSQQEAVPPFEQTSGPKASAPPRSRDGCLGACLTL